MTLARVGAYSATMLNGWQHRGSFVIKFSAETNPEKGRFVGRVEHVASGKTTRFESADALVRFLNDVLNNVRQEFQQADTWVE
ncbi:MAG TPA: hypothetical protein VJ306_19100 [Pyrinomonadaceae bacterium]|nr:hypothetical protein [Pyrinomonadaceae bacterium]